MWRDTICGTLSFGMVWMSKAKIQSESRSVIPQRTSRTRITEFRCLRCWQTRVKMNASWIVVVHRAFSLPPHLTLSQNPRIRAPTLQARNKVRCRLSPSNLDHYSWYCCPGGASDGSDSSDLSGLELAANLLLKGAPGEYLLVCIFESSALVARLIPMFQKAFILKVLSKVKQTQPRLMISWKSMIVKVVHLLEYRWAFVCMLLKSNAVINQSVVHF